ncbi:Uncharacterised protein [Mycobacteroides abscessus]|nr:Uncharacterised protein [Mycobacteroides abscessus]
MSEQKPKDPKARELLDAAARITDALAFARGPRGEVLYLTDDQRVCFAFHLARTGGDIYPDKAIIKRRALPDRPGQLTGVIDWVPLDGKRTPRPPNPSQRSGRSRCRPSCPISTP